MGGPRSMERQENKLLLGIWLHSQGLNIGKGQENFSCNHSLLIDRTAMALVLELGAEPSR